MRAQERVLSRVFLSFLTLTVGWLLVPLRSGTQEGEQVWGGVAGEG